MIDLTIRNSGGKKIYVRKENVVNVKGGSGSGPAFSTVVFVSGPTADVEGDEATVAAALA